MKKPKRKNKKENRFVQMAVFGGLIFLLALMGYGVISKNKKETPPEAIHLTIPQEQIYAELLTQYYCSCGACDLKLSDCNCETALKTKKDMRNRLKEGASKEDLKWYLENVIGSKPYM